MTEKEFEEKFIEVAKILGVFFGVPLAIYVFAWIGMIALCLISAAQIG